MHAHAEVWIPTADDYVRQVTQILAPHEVREDVDEGGFWDWWQIGGRYTGEGSEYRPEMDERNYKKCHWCNGTGMRSDAIGIAARSRDPTYTCNACGDVNADVGWTHGLMGPGKELKWPTEWIDVPENVRHVSAISPDLTCYTLILPNEVLRTQLWDRDQKDWRDTEFDGYVKRALDSRNITDGFLVVVDYHW